jgi:LPXTG-site transpeptidase (sortase) family protein
LIAGGLATAFLVMAFTFGNPAQGVVLEVETATLPTLLSPPSTTASAAEPEPTAAGTLPPPTTASTTLLPERVPPTELTINDLSISQPILAVGLEDDGSMEVPDVQDIGWYLHGAVPGHPGATVLVAHVYWAGTPGPFHQLGKLEPGARIDVGVEDTVHSYVVVERTMYDKDALPRSLWRNSGPETLVLITCGGDYNRSTKRYEQNIVIYAVPIVEGTDALPSF